MAIESDEMNRNGSRTTRRLVIVVGAFVLIAASVYLWLAVAVMLFLALTDITGFLTNVLAITLFVLLAGSAFVLLLLGLRLLRRTRVGRNTRH